MIEHYDQTIILLFQFIVVFIYGILLFFRKDEIFKEDKIIENILIFFIFGCGLKILGLSIFDEFFNIILLFFIISIIYKYKKFNFKEYLKNNIIVLIILTFLIFRIFENINSDNFINYFRFLIIIFSIIIYSFYFFSSSKIQKINYDLLLNIGIFYFLIFITLSLIIDLAFINHKIDPSYVWNNYRTHQLDKIVFQNLYWQGISTSNFAFFPFIYLLIRKKTSLTRKEIILTTIVSIIAVYWHSMQLIFVIISLYLFLIIKNLKNLKIILSSLGVTVLFLITIAVITTKSLDKEKKNYLKVEQYSNQFINLFNIVENIFTFNSIDKKQAEDLQSYAIIKDTKRKLYLFNLEDGIIIKNLSLQDKIVPILLTLSRDRNKKEIIFGGGFRSYRETVPYLFEKNPNFFQYRSKEDDAIELQDIEKSENYIQEKIQPITECIKNLKLQTYNCNSILNYSKYDSPTTLIATIYDYGYLFLFIILIFCLNSLYKFKNERLNLLIIYFYFFIFVFSSDLTDTLLFYFLFIIFNNLISHEKNNISYIS
jgi:hypothetical protein